MLKTEVSSLFFQRGADPLVPNPSAVLSSVRYGCGGPAFLGDVAVPTPVLPAGQFQYTDWMSGGVSRHGEYRGCRYRFDAQCLFGAITLSEQSFPAKPAQSSLLQVSQAAYEAVFAVMAHTGFTHLVRCWNYVPCINAPDVDGIERYVQFNIGRQNAFIAAQRAHLGEVPAACALGIAGDTLVLYFMAAHTKPQALENPRQVSAYHYPEQYGPRSPTFSRASLLRLSDGEVFFISGTASIVGHESCHIGDVVAQTDETMRNIATLVDQANLHSALGGYTLEELEYKVFLRDTADYARVASALQRYLGVPPQAMYVQADVCRAELLVEVEALAFRRSG